MVSSSSTAPPTRLEQTRVQAALGKALAALGRGHVTASEGRAAEAAEALAKPSREFLYAAVDLVAPGRALRHEMTVAQAEHHAGTRDRAAGGAEPADACTEAGGHA